MLSGAGLQMREGVSSKQHAAESANLCSAWLAFIRYCQELGHGEIEKLKIQDGLPVLAEQAFKKIKF